MPQKLTPQNLVQQKLLQQEEGEQLSDHRASLPDELPAGYYLDDFQTLLGFVSTTYPHLLSKAEQSLIGDFFRLDVDARKLFVRLSNRKGPLFRVDRLDYPELELEGALASLSANQFIRRAIPATEDALQLSTRAELLSVCPDASSGIKKADLMAICIKEDLNPVEINQTDVIEVLRQHELLVIKLLFFGNFHQDMTEFVMGELIAPFEKYELSGDACPFRDRQMVDQLVFLKQLSDISHEVVEVDESGDLMMEMGELLAQRPSDHILRRRYDRVLLRLARQMERLERFSDALDLYGRTSATPSRERQARIHAKQNHPDLALSLCHRIIASPLDDEEREFACGFGARLAKKHARDWPHPLPRALADIPQRTIYVAQTDSRVELAATTHFSDQGYDARYVENMLFRSLFGLAFWDVIFAPVPGAFFNPFQRAPQDVHTPDFLDNRRALIDARMRDIANGQLEALVIDHFRSKLGLANQFVNWRYLDADLLNTALTKIPVAHCLAIFERLVHDIKDNGSGFPDLVLFDDDGYRLVEIKGPGDKLQKNQIRWFHYFRDHDIPAEVVNVEYRQ